MDCQIGPLRFASKLYARKRGGDRRQREGNNGNGIGCKAPDSVRSGLRCSSSYYCNKSTARYDSHLTVTGDIWAPAAAATVRTANEAQMGQTCKAALYSFVTASISGTFIGRISSVELGMSRHGSDHIVTLWPLGGGSFLCALAGRWLGLAAGRHRIICHDDDANWKSHILATDSMTLPHQHLRPSPLLIAAANLTSSGRDEKLRVR
ncbi:hypothetical protein DAPPUDRAFT_251847 [Daphnia pulex]|uniref:Uncharacterized protein n=1 Tax=Daphnia pulex TaxID=6669 RepID=E9H1H5_DAPPU|nr:hypothetical protein DAPPUDRAFT_251847 [Daphnia pulex]|eukprot:EFX74352.1 hypothetical protein DAPPUDRAFT_251847 [Daphnia pulex]